MQFTMEEMLVSTYTSGRQALHCDLQQLGGKHSHAEISWVHSFPLQSRSQGDRKRNGGILLIVLNTTET